MQLDALEAASPPTRLTFVAAFLLAFPLSEPTLGGLLVSVAWGLLCAVGITVIVRRRLILAGTMAIAFGLAYGQGLGQVLVEGVERNGVHASPGATQLGFLLLLVFLTGTVALTGAVRDSLARRWPSAESSDPEPVGLNLALMVLFGLTFVAAIQAGFWTYWGAGDSSETEAVGGFRLELFYPPMLFALLGHIALRPWPVARQRRPWPVWLPRLIVGVVLVALMFLLQSRRIMAMGGSVVLLVWLTRPRPRVARSGTAALRIVAVIALLAVMLSASAGWRAVVGEEGSMADRLQRAATTVGDTESFVAIEGRLTYLWLDAMTVEMHHGHHTTLDLVDLGVSKFAFAVPSFIFRGKADVEPMSCESSYQAIGIIWDLPCTPTTEGWLVGEWLGIFLAILLWGVPIGVAEFLVGSRRGLSNVLGFFLFFGFALIESGLFAVLNGLRNVLLVSLICGSLMIAWRLVTSVASRRSLPPRSLPPRSLPPRSPDPPG